VDPHTHTHTHTHKPLTVGVEMKTLVNDFSGLIYSTCNTERPTVMRKLVYIKMYVLAYHFTFYLSHVNVNFMLVCIKVFFK
jgi:uncharacterized membrane protein YeiH